MFFAGQFILRKVAAWRGPQWGLLEKVGASRKTIMKQASGLMDLKPWQILWQKIPRSLCAYIFCAILLATLCPPILPAANIGTVVSVIGQAADLVYDSQRGLVYIANFTQNRIEVYSVAAKALQAPINLGNSPAALAISTDNSTLYIANSLTNGSISLVNLSNQALISTVNLGARPDSLAVGNDGNVLIMGSTGLLLLNPSAGAATSVANSPPGSAAPGASIAGTLPIPAGFRASLSATPDGRLIFGMATNSSTVSRVFVYQVASQTVLSSRNVLGLNAATAASPDGSKFMAGPFLFDSNTLAILGRTGLPAATLTGGSVFSIDGNSVWATFSTQPAIWPNNPNNPQVAGQTHPAGATLSLGVLQQLKSSNLAATLGLRLPDAIIGKAIVSSDGKNIFALSQSGMVVVPIGSLGSAPVISVSQSSVILSADICNRGVQTTPVQIANAGSGAITFSANATAPTGAPTGTTPPTAILSASSGVAPSTLNITMDPRSATTSITPSTVVSNVQLISSQAVNIEPTITVNLNFRDVDQIGTIVAKSGTLTDILADPTRTRIYLADSLNNQIQIFDTGLQAFLPPIDVGAAPHSMALSGPNTLVVANSASENISVVDLNALQQVQLIPLTPISVTASPLFPSNIAATNNAILFTTIPLAASGATPGNASPGVWQVNLTSSTAYPRPNLGTLNSTAQANTTDYRAMVVAAGNGAGAVVATTLNGGTLILYDPSTDSFPLVKTGLFSSLRGSVSSAPDGSYYVVDNTVYNSTLAVLGTIAANPTGTVTQGSMGTSTTQIFRVRTGATGSGADTREFLERLSTSSLTANQSSAMVESMINSPYAPSGATQALPRAMTFDTPTGNAYMLTTSGLSIMSLTVASGAVPSFPANGVVNGGSFRPQGSVAPGSIISIFGTNLGSSAGAASLPLPTSLGGTCVTANDSSLPLFYVSAAQINAQLPFTTPAGTVTVQIRNRNTGKVSSGIAVKVVPSTPGIFTALDTVSGETVAAIYHSSNGTLVAPANQATRDEVLTMYVTGLGAVTPSVTAGTAAPLAPLSNVTVAPQVCIGVNTDGTLHPMIDDPSQGGFAGLAPGFAGLYQINFTVPGDRVQSLAAPVVVTQGASCTTASPAGAPITSIR
jgi:uncharacterized protein (TIGR03437 family)